MDTFWYIHNPPRKRMEFRLVTVNEDGIILQHLATVHKYDNRWYWVTLPPKLRKGIAESNDLARSQAEAALDL